MADVSDRVMWIWGPLALLGVLIVVFRLADTGAPEAGGGSDDAARAIALSAAPGSAPAAGRPPADGRALASRSLPPQWESPAYPAVAGPPSCWEASAACPPWAGYWSPPRFPRPGDHSGRYWGTGSPEWGPPIGEFGPNAQVDPYWWVQPGPPAQ